MKSPTIFLLLTVLTGHCYGQLAGVPKCSVAESKRFALCGGQPMIMNLNTTFPYDQTSANVYCRDARASIACIKDFTNKCLTDLPKQASSLVNYGYRKHIRTVCKTPQSRRELGEKFKCNNQAMDKLDSAMTVFIDTYRRVPLMEAKVRITGLCCGYYSFLDNVLTESSKVCSKSDSDFLRTFIDSFASDILEVLCSQVAQNKAICDTIQFPAETIKDELSASYFPPMLYALSNL
ncbi:hypothetical protein HDE_14546 [Halotydeus destructor]|nr:hypothetical protein HDE_14546 [Halotydeus destructor]